MKKLALKLLLVAVLVYAGAGQAVAQPPPEMVGWWQRAITAAHAAIASVKGVAIAPGLDEMPEVAAKLAQRASDTNQRAITGNLKGQDLLPKIPGGVRLAGKGPTLEYLNKHDLSHVLSVKHHPELAAQPDNLVFELLKWNRARGSNDMKLLDKFRLRVHNAAASIAGAGRIVLTTVAKGGVIGALVELPVTTAEETLHVFNKRKTVKQATKDAAQTVGVATVAGGAAASALTVAGTFGFTVGAPVLVPLALVGGSAYVWVSSDRVWNALDDETRAALKTRLVVVLGAIGNSFHEWHDRTRVATKTATKTLQDYIHAGITAVTWRE